MSSTHSKEDSNLLYLKAYECLKYEMKVCFKKIVFISLNIGR